MSSVPGRYADKPVDASTSSSTMSSAAVNTIRPQSYSGLETMSRPYNDGIPDPYAASHFDNQPAASQAPRPQRLPPPQSMMAGIPYATEPFPPHSQDNHYFNSTHFQQDRPSTTSRVSPSPLPSPTHFHTPAGSIPHQSYQSRNVPDLAHITHPIQYLPVDRVGSSLGPTPPAASEVARIEALRPQSAISTSHQHYLDTKTTVNEPKLTQQVPLATLVIQPESTMSTPSLSRPTPAESPAATRIPNLIDPSRAQALADIDFKLRMRQEPNAARACGFGDRDRRVIDPPPIVELVVNCPTLTSDEIRAYLRYESYVMSCAIYDESGTRDSSYMPEEYQHQRRLMGSLVATPFVGQDENNQEGCFFCFSDLSCRTPGTFRLKFTLMMIDPARAGTVKHFPILAEIKSDTFKVYSAKEFPGMVASSSLAKRLKEQGCIISIKKGNEKTKNARGQGELSENEEDEDAEGSQGQRKRRVIRN